MSTLKKITVLVCEPNKRPRRAVIEDTLEAEQALVGGLIEVAYPPSHKDNTMIVCNEEGKLDNLDINRCLYAADGYPYDVVFGTFFVVTDDGEGGFASLTEEQLTVYGFMYYNYLTDADRAPLAALCEPRFEITWR